MGLGSGQEHRSNGGHRFFICEIRFCVTNEEESDGGLDKEDDSEDGKGNCYFTIVFLPRSRDHVAQNHQGRTAVSSCVMCQPNLMMFTLEAKP